MQMMPNLWNLILLFNYSILILMILILFFNKINLIYLKIIKNNYKW